MEQYANPYSVAGAVPEERAGFIRRTYAHLALAILAFVGIEFLLFQIPAAVNLGMAMATSGKGWLIVLGAFMVVSWIANHWAMSDTSKGLQYAGLGLFIVAEAIIFLPLLLVAQQMTPGGELIGQAGVATLFVFAGLTATVFITKKDFSFLRGFLVIGGFVAIGVIVVGLIFGFELGTWFSAAMVLFASVAILYKTSNIMHHYRTEQHVAAALALFASVALLFWYILRIFMSRR
ncbi:MAG: permease [Verrucomicrobiales bacterium]|nr:permease [Verrucomicrobiales bacterium]